MRRKSNATAIAFVVESDKRCKSDWIYIKDTIIFGKTNSRYEKKKESEQFKAKKMIRNVESGKLLQRSIALEKSNLMTVLDQFLERKREK